jgi:hypothetical protein
MSCFSGIENPFYFFVLFRLVESLTGLSRAGSITIFYCLIWDSPNLEGQVPVIMSQQEECDPVISPGTGFPLVSSYDSQGYGGGVLTCLHTVLAYVKKFIVKVTLRLTVGQSVCIVVEPLLVLMTRCFYCFKIAVVSLWSALSDERSGLPIVSHSLQYLVVC